MRQKNKQILEIRISAVVSIKTHNSQKNNGEIKNCIHLAELDKQVCCSSLDTSPESIVFWSKYEKQNTQLENYIQTHGSEYVSGNINSLYESGFK